MPPTRRPIVALLPALLGACAAAAETRRFTLDDLDRIVRLEAAEIAPDGRSVAVVVAKVDAGENRFDRELGLVDARTGSSRVLVRERPGLASPRWSPAGDRLAFVAETGDGDGAPGARPSARRRRGPQRGGRRARPGPDREPHLADGRPRGRRRADLPAGLLTRPRLAPRALHPRRPHRGFERGLLAPGPAHGRAGMGGLPAQLPGQRDRAPPGRLPGGGGGRGRAGPSRHVQPLGPQRPAAPRDRGLALDGHFPADPARRKDVYRRWLAWLEEHLR